MAKERSRARRSLLALGQRVEKFRQQKGWTRTTLATRAGVAVATIRACETGTKVTQPNKLQKIARALGMTSKRLETDDTLDPRVNHWTDEDYEIGNWYHNAPRQVKNWIWSLQESSGAPTVLSDDLFLRVLDHWPRLTQQ